MPTLTRMEVPLPLAQEHSLRVCHSCRWTPRGVLAQPSGGTLDMRRQAMLRLGCTGEGDKNRGEQGKEGTGIVEELGSRRRQYWRQGPPQPSLSLFLLTWI